jgi:ribonucleoside-diphosphate reductase alpha chain
MMGHRYDSDSGREIATRALGCIRDEAYSMSIALAEEKGHFPYFERDAFLSGRYVQQLSSSIRDGIAEHGIRNSHLISIAPAGSISILANNVSSGIEPVFSPTMKRAVLDKHGVPAYWKAIDHAYSIWTKSGRRNSNLPKVFVTAHELTPEAHLLMAAALQPSVDNSISKTVNVAEDISKEDFRGIYRRAYDLGLKGCTVFRSNPVTGEILSEVPPASDSLHCCGLEREGD